MAEKEKRIIRDSKGQFMPGAKAAIGRRQGILPKTYQQQMRELAQGQVKESDLKKLMANLIKVATSEPEKGKDSNWQFAVTKIMEYTMGKPVAQVEVESNHTSTQFRFTVADGKSPLNIVPIDTEATPIEGSEGEE